MNLPATTSRASSPPPSRASALAARARRRRLFCGNPPWPRNRAESSSVETRGVFPWRVKKTKNKTSDMVTLDSGQAGEYNQMAAFRANAKTLQRRKDAVHVRVDLGTRSWLWCSAVLTTCCPKDEERASLPWSESESANVP